MAESKYVGIQSGPGVIRVRIGSEEVDLTYDECKRIENALKLARIGAALRSR